MPNIIGPFGPGVNETVTRPQDVASQLEDDTWFAPCQNNDPATGTKIPALWLNKVTALLRRAIRGMNVPQNELDDDMLLKAIQRAQRGIENVGDGVEIYAGLNEATGKHQIRTIKGVNITIAIEDGVLVLTGSPPATSPALAAIAPMMLVEEQRAGNAAAGVLNGGGTPTTRPLNTVIANQIDGASLANNRITLPAGIYRAEFGAGAWNAETHYVRLWNVTAGKMIGRGTSGDSQTTGQEPQMNPSVGIARFTLAEQSQLELQHMMPVGGSTGGNPPRLGDMNNISPDYYVDSWIAITKEG